MIDSQDQTSAIPRLYKLSHLEVVLQEAYQGASFERMRQALLDYARRERDQGGRGVLSQLHNEYTSWSPTQEALSELMRLGMMVRDQVPSGRQYVDAYRARTYQLTPSGREAAQALSRRDAVARAKFLDMLTVSLARVHPGFASLIAVVDEDPLFIPEYTLGRISGLKGDEPLTQKLAGDVISLVLDRWPQGTAEPSETNLAAWLDHALKRRFPTDRVRKPSQKDVLDTVNDAVLGFVVKARGIKLDPISFNVCMSWAGQLAVLEQSRYVERWPGRTVWATACIRDSRIHRRGFHEAETKVLRELKGAFRSVAAGTPHAGASGYLPIYRVRAQVAFATKVNHRLVDFILRKILSGEIETPYEVKVALGRGTPPPTSERVFTHDGRRFFDIMITE